MVSANRKLAIDAELRNVTQRYRKPTRDVERKQDVAVLHKVCETRVICP
jgi:hypothetical protein